MPALTFLAPHQPASHEREWLARNLTQHSLTMTGFHPTEEAGHYRVEWVAASPAAKFLDRFGKAARERVHSVIVSMGGVPEERSPTGLNPVKWVTGTRAPTTDRTH